MILQLWYQEVVAAEYIATLLGRIPLQEKRTVTCETKLNWQKRQKQRLDEKFKNAEIDRDRWKWIGLTDRRNSEKNRFEGLKVFRASAGKFKFSWLQCQTGLPMFVRSTEKIGKLEKSSRLIFSRTQFFWAFGRKKRFHFFSRFFGFPNFKVGGEWDRYRSRLRRERTIRPKKIEWTPFWHTKR